MNSKHDTIGLPLKKLKILNEVRKVFYEITNLGLSFYYAGDEDYDFYPPNEKNSYCTYIQEIMGKDACKKSDFDALGRACRSGKYCLYTCHAGLINVVVPLSFKGRTLGAMFTGQLTAEPHSESAFKKMTGNIDLTKEQRDILYSHYLSIRQFDKDKLLLSIKLIVFMANYIIDTENIMYLQSEIFRKEERILQYENEKMRLRNNLQKLSIKVLGDQVFQQSEASKLSYSQNRKLLIVRRAEELIQKHYYHTFTVEDIANAIYLSPNYFSTIFKEITKTTFNNYLNEVRIEQGKILLIKTDMPIKEIFIKVGFKDYNYFNRVFKRIAGLPPAAFRELHRKKIL